MRVVVRNWKYEKRHLYAHHVPEFFVYEGDQVPSFKWCEPGTICLTTGDPLFPIRQISPSSIVSVDDKPIELPKVEPKERVYTVQGSKGASYTVTIGPRGKSCNCAGFQFRRACKHVNQALEKEMA